VVRVVSEEFAASNFKIVEEDCCTMLKDGGRRFSRNAGAYISTLTVPYPRKLESSWKSFLENTIQPRYQTKKFFEANFKLPISTFSRLRNNA